MVKPLPPVLVVRFSGTRLKKARLHAGLSRFKLAQRIGFAAGMQTLTRYENGRYVPTIDVALALARALDVNLEDLTDAKG
jgi:transcriptional regulator with XRE-family HTH domain